MCTVDAGLPAYPDRTFALRPVGAISTQGVFKAVKADTTALAADSLAVATELPETLPDSTAVQPVPADSLTAEPPVVPEDSLDPLSQKKELEKARKAEEKRLREEEKARIAAEKQAAREAKWAEKDKKYEEKQAAKAQRKLEKERKRKLRALRKLEKKAQKERRLFEKYLEQERLKAEKKAAREAEKAARKAEKNREKEELL